MKSPATTQSSSSTYISKLKDPFVICCLLGVLVFTISWYIGNEDQDRLIIVTEAEIHRIQQQWLLEQGRLPNDDELANLIDAFVQEEMQVREALALGLDQNDTIIRRRLIQKYQFLSEEPGTSEPVTEAQLNEFYKANTTLYTLGQTTSFRHIYFNNANDEHSREAIEVIAESVNDDNWFDLGDPIPTPREFKSVSDQQVVNTFGNRFRSELNNVELDNWSGPIDSTYGLHLVKILDRTPSRVAEFESVRNRVKLDYEAILREQAYLDRLKEISTRYTVDIEETTLNP
ncbi:MAG: peptidylprolyl isomerase [Gammaproteobacteria bacterium]|nr:peptidylprolyl isomerase [Gammaproteobacteria bacterium]